MDTGTADPDQERREPPPPAHPHPRPGWRYVVPVVGVLAAAVLVAPDRVAGHSMEPTLRPGNVVLTLRHLPGLHDPIHRRALVTARDPLTGAMLV